MQAPRVRIALAITSHERPDALAAVFASIRRLRVAPDEIVIADDGSGPATQAVIASFIAASRGARTAGRAVSRGLSRCTTAQPRHRRDPARLPGVHRRRHGAAPRIHRGPRTPGAAWELHPGHPRARRRAAHNHADQQSREHGHALHARRRIPAARISAALAAPVRRYSGTRAMAWLPSRVAIRVSGATTWFGSMASTRSSLAGGPRTRSCALVWKIRGSERQTLLFGGIACHLHHAPASREQLPGNLARLEATRRERKVRCERGLDLHMR